MSSETLKALARDLGQCWKTLALADLLYKTVAAVVLAPLVMFLFQLFLIARGSPVLADEDIAAFFAGPLGWACIVVVGGGSLAVLALQQTALVIVVCGAHQARRVTVIEAFRFTLRRAWGVWHLTTRIAGWGLVIATPFLAAAAAVYLGLLTRYDINYYLVARPPAFWTAVVLGVLLGLGLVLAGLHAAAVFLLALPLLLFEGVGPGAALRASRRRTRGHRRTIWLWVGGWFLAGTALSAAAAAVVNLLGTVTVPYVAESLPLLLLAVGLLVVMMLAAQLAVSIISTTTFAVLLFDLYRRLGGRVSLPDELPEQEAATRTTPASAVTRGRLAALVGAAAAVSAVAGVVVLRSLRLEDDTEITAHRGASAMAPENTLAAVRAAIAAGADWVEIDVQETADGQVVVMHDSDFKKLAGVDLKTWDATMDDLAVLDVGSWFGPEFAGERVPTLDQVLAACQGRIGVTIELKYYGHDERLEERVAACVERQNMQGQIAIMSLKQEAVEEMKRLRPRWTVGRLTAVSLGDLTEVEADFLAINSDIATRRFIAEAHRAGKPVWVWTVDDADRMSRMMSRGADNLITDRPALALEVRRRRAELVSLQRLLLEVAEYFDRSAAAQKMLPGN